MSDYRIPKMEAFDDGSSVSIDLTPMVHDLTRQVVKRVEEGAVAEVVAFLAANGHLADVIRKAKAEAWEHGAFDAALSLGHGGHNAINPYTEEP